MLIFFFNDVVGKVYVTGKWQNRPIVPQALAPYEAYRLLTSLALCV